MNIEEYELKYISKEERDALPDSQFAGPDRTFPIRDEEDLAHVAMLLHHAANPEKVKSKAKQIAKRLDLELPHTWVEESSKSAPSFVEDNEFKVYAGSEVKALGNGKVGGYLVLFSDPKNPDLSGDYFDSNTEFDLERSTKSTVYYSHGLDRTLKTKKLAINDAELKKDEVGIWAEAQLDLRDKYEKAIYAMVKAGKLGWSSGTAPHLVERETIKVGSKSVNYVKTWPLGLDASLTPTPCEPRTLVVSVKSINVDDVQLDIKMTSSDIRETLSHSLNEKHGKHSHYIDHDEDNCYFWVPSSGTEYFEKSYVIGANEGLDVYAQPYKIKEQEDGGHKVKMDEDHYPVRMRHEFVAMPRLNGSRMDNGGHPRLGSSVLAAKESSIYTYNEFKPTCSLKTDFEMCLLQTRSLMERLNSIKELRESQDKKAPLSTDNLSNLKVLSKSIIELIDYTERATELAVNKKNIDIKKLFNDLEEIDSWIDEI